MFRILLSHAVPTVGAHYRIPPQRPSPPSRPSSSLVPGLCPGTHCPRGSAPTFPATNPQTAPVQLCVQLCVRLCQSHSHPILVKNHVIRGVKGRGMVEEAEPRGQCVPGQSPGTRFLKFRLRRHSRPPSLRPTAPGPSVLAQPRLSG